MRDSRAVTQEKEYWLLPTSLTSIEYKELKDIDFVSAKSAKKRLDDSLELPTTPVASNLKCKPISTPEPAAGELQLFYATLSRTKSKPAVLSLVPLYSQKYIPRPVSAN